ncbi:putative ABC transporter protein [Marinobacterium lacunae]|uniref:Putative ABC transporter protein n=1 Tax=Marinobacterium lacunae TaxID=1232683 RepID=A0A081G213_9GAMM|nr:ABC transporter permease [Marinobacterium lacunae]KEA64818.1 putative ABC transporter protein [Marinobacterium lacunae]
MRTADLIQFNLHLLLRQWFRTLMILLATAVGVAAVLLLTGLGEGARRFVLDEFSLLGQDTLILLPGRKETTGGLPPLTGEGTRDITLDDVDALSRLPGIEMVAPLIVGNAQVYVGGRNREIVTLGTSARFFELRQLSMQQGQALPDIPLQQAGAVCVIGPEVRRELFGTQRALGEWIRVGDRRFRVIGIVEDRGESLGMDVSNQVILPVASAQQIFNTQGMFRVLLKVRAGASIERSRERVIELMQQRHGGERDVTLITQDALLGAFTDILGLLTLSVAAIAAISLVVAGILIMNITLISVSQRTAEIGLLKALGASAALVRLLFISEALMLSAFGALIGIISGYALLWLGHSIWPQFPVTVPLWALSGSLIIALGVATLFAWLPASRAARLAPVQALKGEVHDA